MRRFARSLEIGRVKLLDADLRLAVDAALAVSGGRLQRTGDGLHQLLTSIGAIVKVRRRVRAKQRIVGEECRVDDARRVAARRAVRLGDLVVARHAIRRAELNDDELAHIAQHIVERERLAARARVSGT